MTLLQICKDAADECGIPRPSSVISSSDQQVRELLRHANREGQWLVKRHAWQALVTEATFTTSAAESQGAMTTAAGADFDRFANDTMWNRTTSEKVFGPLADTQWQRVKADVTSGVTNWFRIRGGNLLFYPNPAASQTVAFEYVSSYWVDTDADGAGEATTWAADTDTAVLDEDLITMGVVYRWLKQKGLAYADQLAEYNARLETLIGQDGAKPNIDMGGVEYGYLGVNVPEGGFTL